jgi:hypothetical protein
VPGTYWVNKSHNRNINAVSAITFLHIICISNNIFLTILKK